MSYLRQIHPANAENRIQLKQFNVSGTQQSTKKKALADIKNTLHQKSTQHSDVPSTLVKPINFEGRKLFSEENVLATPIMTANLHEKLKKSTKNEILNENSMTTKNSNEMVTACKCHELLEDNDADTEFLFHDFKLNKSQIEAFALNWENTPFCTSKDKRPLFNIEEFEGTECDFDHNGAYESLFETIREISIPLVEDQVPPLLLEDDMFMNGSFDCGIGL